jgi:hypothetical protein
MTQQLRATTAAPSALSKLELLIPLYYFDAAPVACQRIIFGWAVAELVKSFERQWLNVSVLV